MLMLPLSPGPLTPAEEAFLERMMLFAGFPPDRELPADASRTHHVRRFVDGWGRAGDVGVLAVDEARGPVGAAWARVLEKPLLADEHGAPVAELAIAVEPDARGDGLGAALLDALALAAQGAGHEALSLTVSPRNPAHRLYLRCGFEVVGQGEHSLVMRRRLA